MIPALSYDIADSGDQIAVGESLGPDGIDDLVLCINTLLHGQRRKMIDMNWLNTILSVAENTEDWKSPEHPGDIV